MRQIAPVQVDDAKLFLCIALAKKPKRRKRLHEAKAEVLDAYERYLDAAPEVSELTPTSLTSHQRAALLHCYDVETKPLRFLRGRILGSADHAECPFCGINESSTLDHYLPKKAYPEYSVFSANLVPCCSPCNTHKNEHVSAEGARLFQHPYYDPAPSLPFLRVEIDLLCNGLLLDYHVVRPTGMDKQTYRRLRSHFALLKLNERYARMGLNHVGSLCRPLRRAYGGDCDAARVAKHLAISADDYESFRGGQRLALCAVSRPVVVRRILRRRLPNPGQGLNSAPGSVRRTPQTCTRRHFRRSGAHPLVRPSPNLGPASLRSGIPVVGPPPCSLRDACGGGCVLTASSMAANCLCCLW